MQRKQQPLQWSWQVLVVAFLIYGLNDDQERTAEALNAGCDPQCSSVCTKFPGKCDTECDTGFGLEPTTHACQECDTNCTSSCNAKGPGKCDTDCVAGYATNDETSFYCRKFVNGNWSDWNFTIPCSSPGQLTSSQTRLCNNPAPLNGGQQCRTTDGTFSLTETIQLPCPCDSHCDSQCATNGYLKCDGTCKPGWSLNATNKTCIEVSESGSTTASVIASTTVLLTLQDTASRSSMSYSLVQTSASTDRNSTNNVTTKLTAATLIAQLLIKQTFKSNYNNLSDADTVTLTAKTCNGTASAFEKCKQVFNGIRQTGCNALSYRSGSIYGVYQIGVESGAGSVAQLVADAYQILLNDTTDPQGQLTASLGSNVTFITCDNCSSTSVSQDLTSVTATSANTLNTSLTSVTATSANTLNTTSAAWPSSTSVTNGVVNNGTVAVTLTTATTVNGITTLSFSSNAATVPQTTVSQTVSQTVTSNAITSPTSVPPATTTGVPPAATTSLPSLSASAIAITAIVPAVAATALVIVAVVITASSFGAATTGAAVAPAAAAASAAVGTARRPANVRFPNTSAESYMNPYNSMLQYRLGMPTRPVRGNSREPYDLRRPYMRWNTRLQNAY